MPRRRDEPTPAALAESALLEVGLRPGDRVRWQRTSGGSWQEAVVAGLADERFLILPHPQVAEFVRRKAGDPDRWLGGMRKLQRRLHAAE